MKDDVKKYKNIFEQWIKKGCRPSEIPGMDYGEVNYLKELYDHLNEQLCSQLDIAEKRLAESGKWDATQSLV